MDQLIKNNLLDEVEIKINQGQFSDACSTLYDGLSRIRSHSSVEEWKQFITQYREHAISHFFLQEPLTRRAFEKPRGYAGDPVMIDFVYDYDAPPSSRPTEISDILNCELNRISDASHAVRERKRIISRKINQTAERVSNPYILSVACGYLREALDSVAILNRKIGKFVAIDQDKEALSVVAELIKDFGETIHASLIEIISGTVSLPKFDFIYTAGLYDYLPESLAKKLTSILFDLLNPGGRLLIANYLPNTPSIGYMEAVMDWWLIYRDKEQMQELVQQIPPENINDVDMFVEKNQVIIFMEIEKVGGTNLFQ
ncbi:MULTISPECIES: class I SAM-dependent methyltransferase [Paenibacillus]|uniref:class I SAM-dependent methyltransferase n=1 Tax=Paenibacillus TaxID=44249 RepID=UPI0011AA4A44|nr:class I SAM-dependent methyltransferase [Paenibacillus sp. Y412MC10]